MNIRRRPPNPSVRVDSQEYGIPHQDAEPRNILEKIVWEKVSEVEALRKKLPLSELQSQVISLPPPKDFISALREVAMLPAVIAEVKKASPSKGIIREDFDPCFIARSYEEGGATCLSVLTDTKFFQGGFNVLVEVRKVVNLPLLCKDFFLFPYQIYQARVSGADAILLIAAILSDQDLKYLYKIASDLGLTVLVEVHNSIEMKRVLDLKIFSLVGINNRDLATFDVDLNTTKVLSQEFRDEILGQEILLVSESGLFSRFDLDKVYKYGAGAVLVGESLMRQENVKKALKKLIINET
tara:strand:- start:702 stop:1592 length:891 start_codon:yes stop_codon:yes gene_type:complete